MPFALDYLSFSVGNPRGPLDWRTEDGSWTYRDRQEDKLKHAGVRLAGG